VRETLKNQKGKKMKKIAIVALIIVLCLTLTACQIGNRKIGIDTTQTFRWAIIQMGNGELIEGPVDSWRDFDESDVVQITIKGVTYLTHYANAILATKKP
jgi:hypothetical protein